MSQRRAGICFLKVDGVQYPVKGDIKYGLGKPTREAIPSSSGIDGYKETVTVPFIEGEFIDRAELNLDELSNITDSTVVLELANEKVIALRNAWITNPDGLGAGTEEANVAFRFEGLSAEEIQ